MPITTDLESPPPVRPEFFRLPKPGETDPFFGFTRTFFYVGHERGYWTLTKIKAKGKERGVTLVPFAAVLNFVLSKSTDSKGKKESVRG